MTVPAQVWAAVRSVHHPRQEPDMTTVDRTAASDAEFRARVAAFDAAPEPAEVVEYREKVERVARAIWECHPGAVLWDDLSPRTPTRTEYRRLAAAAIAALPVSPAEEALRRVEAVAVWCEQQAASRSHYAKVDPAYRNTVIPYEVTAERLRAALATPLAGQPTTDEEADRG